MEINIMLDKSTSTKFVKDYEVAYNTYLKIMRRHKQRLKPIVTVEVHFKQKHLEVVGLI